MSVCIKEEAALGFRGLGDRQLQQQLELSARVLIVFGEHETFT